MVPSDKIPITSLNQIYQDAVSSCRIFFWLLSDASEVSDTWFTNFKMKNLLLLLTISALLAGCGGECKHEKELAALHEKLTLTEAELSVYLENENTDSVLVHNVFFKTKPELTEKEMTDLMAKLASLDQVESTQNVWVGKPADTGDPRLVSDYQVALQVTFESEEKLAEYQQDAHHLKMREEASKYFAAPPVVYDFWAE